MKDVKHTLIQLTGLFLIFILFASCSSSPQIIEEDLSPAEFFQRANEAADIEKYKLALLYYSTFQERYPDDLDRNLWASYEIAFLYYKMKKEDTALEHFNDLLMQYSTDASVTYPQGPKILAEKVKARIEENKKR